MRNQFHYNLLDSFGHSLNLEKYFLRQLKNELKDVIVNYAVLGEDSFIMRIHNPNKKKSVTLPIRRYLNDVFPEMGQRLTSFDHVTRYLTNPRTRELDNQNLTIEPNDFKTLLIQDI